MQSVARVLIVGAGQAGAQAALSLRSLGFEGAIVLAGEEAFAPYQRPPLSKAYLLGELSSERLTLKADEVWSGQGIDLALDKRAVAIDRSAKTVTFADGGAAPYDALILATGARARALSVPGVELDGVFTLRTRADADALDPRLVARARVVVVGGGFIGLEIAAAAIKRGARVTVLEAAPRLLARTCGPAIAAFFLDEHRARGVDVRLNASVEGFEGATRVTAARLADGEAIAADVVVVGVGGVPNDDVARRSDLACEDGIVTDASGRTEDPSIFAIGDCARAWSPLFERALRLESVQNAVDGGKAVAAALVNAPPPPVAAPWNWSDQFDLKLQLAGLSNVGDVSVLRGSPAARAFSVFSLQEGRLMACDSVNDPATFFAARQLIAAKAHPDPAALADPAVDLRALAMAAARG